MVVVCDTSRKNLNVFLKRTSGRLNLLHRTVQKVSNKEVKQILVCFKNLKSDSPVVLVGSPVCTSSMWQQEFMKRCVLSWMIKVLKVVVWE